MRRDYQVYLDIQQEECIIELLQRLFTVWTSDKSSLDESHNTQLYAKFLKQLMEPHVSRLAMKKRTASVFGPDAPSPTWPAASSASTLTWSDVSSPMAPFGTKAEYSYVWPTTHLGLSGPTASSPVFPHHIPPAGPAAALPRSINFEDLYATDSDISKDRSQLTAAAGMAVHPDMNVGNSRWEHLMTPGASLDGGFGDARGGMMGEISRLRTGSGAADGAMDWNGMLGHECLAAMMGLGDGTWFSTAKHGGS